MPERREGASGEEPDIIDATDKGNYRLQENQEGVLEFVKKEKVGDEEEVESGLEVGFAKEYLETTAGIEYHKQINLDTPESFIATKNKVEPIKSFLPHPKDVVSVGVGSGEEIHALADLYAEEQTKIHGLDLSPQTLLLTKERLAKHGLVLDMIEGSAIDLPFDDHSIDGVVESAILHEIYSYVPDGKHAWKKAISEVALKLSEDGVYLLRDFSAPDQKGEAQVNLTSDIAKKFYDYFRKNYRTFTTWKESDTKNIVDKRSPDELDFLPLVPESDTIVLPMEKAAEIILHFRNFYHDNSKGITNLEDSRWKEINESYLPPNPNLPGKQAMTRAEYVEAVLMEANLALKDTDYEMICVQDKFSLRPDTVKFLNDHFMLDVKDSEKNSEELLSEVTQKMELVFKKITKRLAYDSSGLKIAEAVRDKGRVNVATPNNLNLVFEKGVFIPDSESFNFIQVSEDLIKSLESVETIADIGTGSGAIATSIGKTFKDKVVYAFDVSEEALVLAKKNAQQNSVSNVRFLPNNTKEEWISLDASAKIDFIISNPPYVGDDEFNSPEFDKLYPDYQYQPEGAIRSHDKDGIAPYISIIEAAQAHNTKYILLRVNPNKIDALILVLEAQTPMTTQRIKAKDGKEEFLFISLS